LKPVYFPPHHYANEDGLLCISEVVTLELLIDAYSHGIFPWPTGDPEDPIPWATPDPRPIIPFEDFHVPRRLERTLRSGKFEVTCDKDFAATISAASRIHNQQSDGTWITPELIAAYCEFHEAGFAHSVEVWREGKLVGGIYGVAIGAAFSAESMFYIERDASKVALVHLVRMLQQCGFVLFDVEQLTPQIQRFNAIEIPREEFLQRLEAAKSILTQKLPKVLSYEYKR